ncbi:CoA transferase [Couchioplanes azureus]|uniref:CoA transferase n=1 Tax=Couchioplanes caeruleus TaxID=56438 RepID=UPI00166FBC7B|nr:CoA transferase [Couchioplanes caeruleus]
MDTNQHAGATAGIGAFDEVSAQATYGLMAVHGRAAGRPRRIGVDYLTAATRIVAAQGTLAAELSGLRGQPVGQVRVDPASVALLTVSQYLAAATAADPEHPERYEQRGTPPPFCTIDGIRVELETLDPEPWWTLWTGLQVPARLVDSGWHAFVTRSATAVAPLPPELHEAVAALTYAELVGAARAAGVAVQPVRSHAQRLTDPGLGGGAWSVSVTTDAVRPAAAAHPGGLPLAGLTVVEAGRRVQGPLAAHLLGLLGARVIRVEPDGGDPSRGMPPMVGGCSARFLAVNRGKRVVTARLRTRAGQDTVRELVAGADVFLHNWAPGRAAALGLDSTDLAKVNPGLVYAYASGWGDARGPGAPPGTDSTVQAYAGLGEHLRPADEPPAGSLMTLLDVLGGLVSAEGVLAALVARHADGRGRRVDSSLLSAAGVLQHSRLSGREPARPAWGPLGAPVATRDGWVVAPRTPAGYDDPALPVALAQVSTDEALRALHADGVPAVRVRTDLAELATDPAVRPLLDIDGCAFVRAPWRFLP